MSDSPILSQNVRALPPRTDVMAIKCHTHNRLGRHRLFPIHKTPIWLMVDFHLGEFQGIEIHMEVLHQTSLQGSYNYGIRLYNNS